MMNSLNDLAKKYGTDKQTNDPGLNIYHGYTPIYNKYLAPFRNNDIKLLEIGVREGWSHKMWSDYFRVGHIFGLDNASDCSSESLMSLNTDRIHINICSQDDSTAINNIYNNVTFDFIIDDGSHYSWHQQKTIDILWDKLKPGGIYFIEDLGVCHLRKFREYDDYRSSTTEFLSSLKTNPYSYYIKPNRLQQISDEICEISLFGELAVIIKA